MFTLVIVSMFKNESMILEEWIQYYIDQGVEHFYLIDNGSTDNYEEKINKYIDKITLIKDSFRVKPDTTNKLKMFDDEKKEYIFKDSSLHTQLILPNKYFLEKVKNESKWTMFIDCDEYIYSPKSKNIFCFLKNINENEKCDEITDIFIPWKIFGSSDLNKQPKSIINGFTKRMDINEYKKRTLEHGNIRGHGKSITQTKYLTLLNIHKCNFCKPRKTVMPDGSIVDNNDENIMTKFIKNLNYNEHFIFCNHYMVMSKEYFFEHKTKRAAGCAQQGGNLSESYWKKNNKNDVIDMSLKNYMYKNNKSN